MSIAATVAISATAELLLVALYTVSLKSSHLLTAYNLVKS